MNELYLDQPFDKEMDAYNNIRTCKNCGMERKEERTKKRNKEKEIRKQMKELNKRNKIDK